MSSEKFSIDGIEYSVDELSDKGLAVYRLLHYSKVRAREIENQQAILNKAKNAYISDLNAEIVQGKSGINLSDLFSDD